jgi:hypothetical protein
MSTFVRLLSSAFFAFVLLVPLGAIYGAANLPVYHSWGLAHGSVATAIPALGAASYVLLGFIPWFKSHVDPLPRLIASLSVLVFVTAMFYLNQESMHRFSFWHFVAYIVVFALFTALCLRAAKPFLVPLFLLVPLLAEPLFGFLLTVAYDPASALEIFGRQLTSSILPAALATGASLVTVNVSIKRSA